MASVKVVLNGPGVHQLLKSPEIASVCEAQAARMTRATGVPYVADVYVGKTRVNARGQTRKTEDVDDSRTGKQVGGYYRTLKSGKNHLC